MPDQQWTTFMLQCTAISNGHWTKTTPTEPGAYHTARTDGRYAGVQYVETSAEGGLSVCNSDGAWDGFWWSSPIPMPPTVGLRAQCARERDLLDTARRSAGQAA